MERLKPSVFSSLLGMSHGQPWLPCPRTQAGLTACIALSPALAWTVVRAGSSAQGLAEPGRPAPAQDGDGSSDPSG